HPCQGRGEHARVRVPFRGALRALVQVRVDALALLLVERTDVSIVQQERNVFAIHRRLPARLGASCAASVAARWRARLARARCSRARNTSRLIPVIASISTSPQPSARSDRSACCAGSSLSQAPLKARWLS